MLNAMMTEVAQAMRERGFRVFPVETKEEAKAAVFSLVPEGAAVGAGGSMTLRQIDVLQALSDTGRKVYAAGMPVPDGCGDVMACAREADVYLTSANAVTRAGELVMIDGNCNRVGGVVYGPAMIVFVVSLSKVVDGGMNAAVTRIKRIACPPNARRLKLDTPCARTGVCREDQCGEDCMCRAVVVLQRPPRGRRVTVVLVEESLGY